MSQVALAVPDKELGDMVAAALRQGVLYHDVDADMPCYTCDHCPGFALHFWRKCCLHCRCSRGSHGFKEVAQRQVGKLQGLAELERRQAKTVMTLRKKKKAAKARADKSRTDASMPAIPDEPEPEPGAYINLASPEMLLKYSWVPDGLTDEQIETYMAALPEAKRPIRGSAGELFRIHQLEQQLPPHDLDASACQGLTGDDEKAEFAAFAQRKLDNAADIGIVVEVPIDTPCTMCGQTLHAGELAVTSDRFQQPNGDACYFHHDTCFMCEVCEELLVDLFVFRYGENRLLCGRHWADQHRPRCTACDETIFADDFTFAEDSNWHVQHFCCEKCDKLLVDEEYVAAHGRPHCLPCYRKHIADKCVACGEVIDIKSGKITDGKKGGKAWHTACFKCVACGEALEGKACYPKDNKLYCRADYAHIFKKATRKSQRKKLPKGAQAVGKAGPA